MSAFAFLGDPFLGGDDMDHIIADTLSEQFFAKQQQALTGLDVIVRLKVPGKVLVWTRNMQKTGEQEVTARITRTFLRERLEVTGLAVLINWDEKPALERVDEDTAYFADGSSKFVTNDVDLKIWKAMATRAGGEIDVSQSAP